ncbi:MAG: hypothetical protein ICV87_11035 [Gemmatimonadetes bacterium]|nr:hypothetical protein [Gemmatimonadota bacterium]
MTDRLRSWAISRSIVSTSVTFTSFCWFTLDAQVSAVEPKWEPPRNSRVRRKKSAVSAVRPSDVMTNAATSPECSLSSLRARPDE